MNKREQQRDEKNDPDNNVKHPKDPHKKRPIVKVYDEQKIPDYPKKVIKTEWDDILSQPLPDDFNMIYFFVVKLYDLTVQKLQADMHLEDGVTLSKIQKMIDSLKQLISGSRCLEFQKYNIKCETGKMAMSTAVFLAICSLIIVIQYSLGSSFRISEIQYRQTMNWALEEKLLILDPKDHMKWTMMQIYMQIYTMASRWTTINHRFKFQPFWMLSILEDKVAQILLERHDDTILDGTLDVWTRKVGNIILPTPEYIDNVSGMMKGMDRTLIIITNMTHPKAFKQGVIPNGYLDRYIDLFKKWVDKKKDEDVLTDNLAYAREFSQYYCLREGEVQESIRKNNGTLIKSIKWQLHLTRSYQAQLWMLQEHTYNKKGKVCGFYPMRWQVHCLKLSTYIDILGSFEIVFEKSVYIRDRNFWEIYSDGKVLANPFILETMGHQMVICEGHYYDTQSVEEALLLWTLFLRDKKNFIFNNEGKIKDLSETFQPLLSEWDINYVNEANFEMDEDNDIVV